LVACINKEFPEFHLEDKVKLMERFGIDRFGIVYRRRKKLDS